MMQWKNIKNTFFFLAIMMALITACDGVTGNGGVTENPKSTSAETPKITVQPKAAYSLFAAGQTVELSVAAEVSDGGVLSYQWYKNDLLQEGKTANSYSETVDIKEKSDAVYYCRVTNTLKDGTAYVDSGKVTVKFIASITPSVTDYTLQIDNTQKLEIAGVAGITWASSDKDVVSVGDDGTITAKSAGTATITATAGKLTATWTITINDKINAKVPSITEFKYADVSVTLTENTFSIVDNAKLAVTASSEDEGTLTFQWYKNKAEITGATASEYSVTEIGVYYCKVTNTIKEADNVGNTTAVASTSEVTIKKKEISLQELVTKAQNSSNGVLAFSDTKVTCGTETITIGDSGDYNLLEGNASVTKMLSISSNGLALNSSSLSIEADSVTLSGLAMNSVTAAASLGNGTLTITDCSLSSLLVNGGGANSIHLNGTTKLKDVTLAKQNASDSDEFVRLAIGGNVSIESLSATSSAMMQVADSAKVELTSEVTVSGAANFAASSCVESRGGITVHFAKYNSDAADGSKFEEKFKVQLDSSAALDANFLNQAGTRLWGDDFYGWGWFDYSKYSSDSGAVIIDMTTLTGDNIAALVNNSTLTKTADNEIFLSCKAKEKWFLIPHNLPYGSMYKPVQYLLTHYTELYDFFYDSSKKIEVDNTEHVKLKATLLKSGLVSDGLVPGNLKAYPNSFSTVQDENRNVYACASCSHDGYNNTISNQLYSTVRMFSEDVISKALDDSTTDVLMKNLFTFPEASVGAQFMRLAVDGDGSVLYMLCDEALYSYDLTKSDPQPTAISITWAATPQAIAVGMDKATLYVAEFSYTSGSISGSVNEYNVSGRSASLSKTLRAYSDFTDACTYPENYTGDTCRVGVSDMKTGNGNLYVTSEVAVKVGYSGYYGNYITSRGGLAIISLSTGDVIKKNIGLTENNYPSDTEEYSMFYGPTRILAVEPKKILILDDGVINETEELGIKDSMTGYVTSANPDAVSYTLTLLKEKNRVASYDFEKDILEFANLEAYGLYSAEGGKSLGSN